MTKYIMDHGTTCLKLYDNVTFRKTKFGFFIFDS